MVQVTYSSMHTLTAEIYTLSLHDALPISTCRRNASGTPSRAPISTGSGGRGCVRSTPTRSEEHTSELQSRPHLVCRLLLEKKKQLDGQPIRSCVTPVAAATGKQITTIEAI